MGLIGQISKLYIKQKLWNHQSYPKILTISRSSTMDIILKTSVTEVKHRPLRIVLGWGTEVVD